MRSETDLASTTETEAARRQALIGRGLFPYHDGVRARILDVIVAQQRLQDALPGRDIHHLDDLLAWADPVPAISPSADAADIARHAEILQEDAARRAASPYPADMSSAAALVEIGRVVGIVFDLPPLDEATAVGLSVLERADLLERYLTASMKADENGSDENVLGGGVGQEEPVVVAPTPPPSVAPVVASVAQA